MAESKKQRLFQYFSQNKKRLLSLIKQKGQFQYLCKINGYLYSVEIGTMAGRPLYLTIGIKAGEIHCIDVND